MTGELAVLDLLLLFLNPWHSCCTAERQQLVIALIISHEACNSRDAYQSRVRMHQEELHDSEDDVCQIKGTAYLDQLVPASRDNDRVGGDGAEAHAGHPLEVAIGLTNGVLALSQGVPQLDSLIPGSRHNLQCRWAVLSKAFEQCCPTSNPGHDCC